MTTTLKPKHRRGKTSMWTALVVMIALSSHVLSMTGAVEMESSNHQTATKHSRRMKKERRERHRQEQSVITTPYFTTTSLGARNYAASMGNPLKGLATYAWSAKFEIDHAIEFTYGGLSGVLKDFNTYDWSEFEKNLNATASRKRQLVPRFFITYPPYDSSLPLSILKSIKLGPYTFDGKAAMGPFYNDTVLLDVIKNFIFTYAAKYDGDKRIAYIQPGLLGFWGEYHVLTNPFLPSWVKDNVTTWLKQAFKKTPLMIRYPSPTAKALNVGYHDDSWTFSTLDGDAEGKALAPNESDEVNTSKLILFRILFSTQEIR
jgi:hypothetical protein